MAYDLGEARYKVTVSTRDFDKGIEDTKKKTAELGSSLSSLGSLARGGAVLGGVAALAAGITALGRAAVQAAAEVETVQTTFATFLGSTTAAERFTDSMRELAAATPLAFTQVANGAQQLLAFGFEADTVADRLRLLGDLSLGNAEQFSRLARAYGQVRASGQLYAEELNQFIEAGVPLITALASNLGVAENQIKKLASEGQIHFGDLEQALASLTAQGGLFNNAMENLAQTTTGTINRAVSDAKQVLASFGLLFTPTLRLVAADISSVAEDIRKSRLEEVLDNIGNRIGNFYQLFISQNSPLTELRKLKNESHGWTSVANDITQAYENQAESVRELNYWYKELALSFNNRRREEAIRNAINQVYLMRGVAKSTGEISQEVEEDIRKSIEGASDFFLGRGVGSLVMSALGGGLGVHIGVRELGKLVAPVRGWIQEVTQLNFLLDKTNEELQRIYRIEPTRAAWSSFYTDQAQAVQDELQNLTGAQMAYLAAVRAVRREEEEAETVERRKKILLDALAIAMQRRNEAAAEYLKTQLEALEPDKEPEPPPELTAYQQALKDVAETQRERLELGQALRQAIAANNQEAIELLRDRLQLQDSINASLEEEERRQRRLQDLRDYHARSQAINQTLPAFGFQTGEEVTDSENVLPTQAERIKEEHEEWMKMVQGVVSTLNNLLGSFSGLFQALQANIRATYSSMIREMRSLAAEERNLRQIFEDGNDEQSQWAINRLSQIDEERKARRKAVQEQYAAVVALFYVQKAAALAQAWINTYEAATKAWAQTGPLGGPIGQALAYAAGAAQTVAILAQPPPPPPQFAEGGIVTQPMMGIVGEAGPEAIIPLDRLNTGPSVVVRIEHAYGVPNDEFIRLVREGIHRAERYE